MRLRRKEQRPRAESGEEGQMPLCSGTACVTAAEVLCSQQQLQQSGQVTSEWAARGSFPETGPLRQDGACERAAWPYAQGPRSYELSRLCELTKE